MRKYLFFLCIIIGASSFAQKVVLSDFRVEKSFKNRVYFESSDAIEDASISGMYISGKSISAIHINGSSKSGHYLTCSNDFTYWDNNTIRYEGSESNIVQFALTYIKNNIEEPETNRSYYVSTSGNDSNNGTSESSAFRTINKAASVATAGSTVWVKAGNYGEEYVEVKNTGTKSEPIKFVGYSKEIGDINTMYYNYGDGDLDSSKMPLIDHGKPISKTYAFKASGKDYIIIRNFQFANCNQAIYNESGDGNIIDNCIAKEVGSESAAYGRSFYHNGDGINNRTLNSVSINASRSSFTTNSDYTLFFNNRAYCNEPGTNESTDYYFQLGNKASHCIIIDNYAKRDGELYHSGHGLSIENTEHTSRITEYNLVQNFTSVNMRGVELRHSGVRYNVVRGMIIYGEGAGSNKSTGIMIRDGAHNNIVENCVIDTGGRNPGIYFWDSAEDEASFGFDNIIRNNVFKNCSVGIYMNDSEGNSGKGTGNKIYNNTFYGISSFFRQKGSPNFGNNEIKNNVLHSVSKYEYAGGDANGWSLDYNNFYDGISGKGSNSLNENPSFENESNNNFRLKSTSKIRKKGIQLEELAMDFDCNPRPSYARPDIGAFEYIDENSVIAAVEADAGKDIEICYGEEVTLTASGGKTYAWDTGSNSSSITVSPEETTTFIVRVSDGLTEDTDEVTVTVNRVRANAGSDVTITAGETTTLTASGGDTYLWSNGATSSKIEVSPEATTIYTVTVATRGCQSIAEVKVIVEQGSVPEDTAPPVSSVVAEAGQDREICYGEEVTLTASGGKTYAWDTGSNSASITVSPTETTTYIVKVSDGITEDTDEVTVTVNRVNAGAGNDISITEGESVTLSASGGERYVWSTGETSQTIQVSPEESTTYSVIAYVLSCYSSASVKVEVKNRAEEIEVSRANAGEDVVICKGESIQLNGTGDGVFLWDTGEVSKSIVVNPTVSQSYVLEVSKNGVISRDSVLVTVEDCYDSPLEEEVIPNVEMVVYPNPTQGTFNIKIDNLNKEAKLVINDINGKIIFQDDILKSNVPFQKELNFSGFADGVYFVRVHDDLNSVIRKLILL